MNGKPGSIAVFWCGRGNGVSAAQSVGGRGEGGSSAEMLDVFKQEPCMPYRHEAPRGMADDFLNTHRQIPYDLYWRECRKMDTTALVFQT